MRGRLSAGEILAGTWEQTTATIRAIATIPAQTVAAVRSLFTGAERGGDSLVSVVGVGQIAVEAVQATPDSADRVASLLTLLGSLNISLFVMNLIPLLPLDGGHVVNALYEGSKRTWARLRGRPRPGPADLARSMPIGYVVFGVLLLFGGVMILADIFNPVQF